jgi:hypothetical protein
MTIQVTGTLVDPTNQPLPQAVIRVKALDTSTVIASTSAKVTAGLDGTYTFSLSNGKYSLEILQTDKYNKVSYVEVTALSTAVVTIEELISEAGYCNVVAPTCPI